jgi:hypothetical protein
MTDVIKRVLPPKFKGSIREEMHKRYLSQGPQYKIQTSENNFDHRDGPLEYGFWSAYRQLFLFAMRHFFGLTDIHPLCFNQCSERLRFDRSELWRRFKQCAVEIGFILPDLKSSCPTVSIESIAINQLLTRLRPPKLFQYDNAVITEWSSRIAGFLMQMTPRKVSYPMPLQSWDSVEEWSLDERCGMTDTRTFFSDQKHLFLYNIYSKDQVRYENMTSFAVKRDIFKSFFPDFGEIDIQSMHQPEPTMHDDVMMSDVPPVIREPMVPQPTMLPPLGPIGAVPKPMSVHTQPQALENTFQNTSQLFSITN